jgi:hypothetical protein
MQKFPLLLVLVAALLLVAVAPASAGNIVVTGANIQYPTSQVTTPSSSTYAYTAPAGQSISIMEFQVPLNTDVAFSLTYGDSQNVEGGIIYNYVGPFQSYSQVTLGDYEYNETFTDVYVVSTAIGKKVHFTSYAKDKSTIPNTTGFATYAQGYGLTSQEIVFYPVDDIKNNMISGVSFAATNPIILHIEAEDSSTLATHITNTVGEAQSQAGTDALTVLLDSLNSIWSAMTAITYWVKLLTLENIILVFALYLFGTLAAAFSKQAVRKNPDMFQAFKDFFSLQVAFLRTFVWLWHKIVFILTSLVQALLKWL